ncbi:MAG TPA: hypothetical protein PKL17_02265 [Pseudomonadota bacterium]|nr:hypothetical protein [Pseudomonadota bacterium]
MKPPDLCRRLLPWIVSGLCGCLHFQPIDRPLGDDLNERAALIDRAQHGAMGQRQQVLVAKALMATHGEELSRLKSLIDRGTDGATLHRLIYHDVSDPVLRQALVAHLAREARSTDALTAHVPRDKVRVLSDIDDTLVRSLCDERYEKHTLLPGVLEFYRALSVGARAREVEAQAPGEVTFLSARPKELSGLSYSSLLNPLLSARGQIIAGYNLLPAPAAVPGIGNVHEVQAFAKFRNFVELATLYPESDFVFIGDSGQGDMLGGELMLYHQPERMRAVFIHQIITDGKHGILCPYPRSQSDLDRGTSRVVFFDTYIGAAAQAHEWGLISEDSLYVVTKSAIETLNQRGSEILTAKLRNLVIAQFRRDIRRVQEILANHPVDTARDRLPDLLLAESSCEKNPATKNP